MSLTAFAAGFLPWGSTTDEGPTGLEGLRQLLKEREAELTLTATFGEPQPNMTGEPTVEFPYQLYTSEGTLYGTGFKQFSLPDNGLNETDSNLVRFLASANGIEPSDVDFEDLSAIEGTNAQARVNESGDMEVAP